MTTARGGEDGPFQEIDSRLTIYALANGMDLAKEPGVRRLGWYREGREREIRVAALGDGGFALMAAAFPTGGEGTAEESVAEVSVAEVASASDLVERLTALLEEAQGRANEL